MHKGRLEAFSDGVMAIIITIMVLELKVPHATDVDSLISLAPVFLSYVLSFIYVGIYWSNHHHMFQIVKNVNGSVLWANTHLLFWLSLIPFVTSWAGENHYATIPVALYGFVLLMCSIAYFILTRALLAIHEKDSSLSVAIGQDSKGKMSTAIYIIGIPATFLSVYLGLALYVVVAFIWLIPDRRVEEVITT
ncbi:MAG: DUF1211 domain-containing protein [Rhizobacter sp.]|nr:DUF1211 domain-containing protein [Bacteriovorax sp.]